MSEQKKIALITGANKGIGLETGRQLGKLGITVLIGARDVAKGEAAAKTLQDEGIDAHAIKLDVSDYADHKIVADQIEKQFGGLDILINNAGVLLDGGRGKEDAVSTPDALLRETFDVNFFSLIALTQTLLPLIRKSPSRDVSVQSLRLVQCCFERLLLHHQEKVAAG